MDGTLLFIASLAAAACGLLYLAARRRRPAGASRVSRGASRAPAGPAAKAAPATRSKFHGVSIQLGNPACAVAKARAAERFLPNEAPALPLAGCDVARCNCRYEHHDDRRDEQDRRDSWGNFGGFGPRDSGKNERSGDRRFGKKKPRTPA